MTGQALYLPAQGSAGPALQGVRQRPPKGGGVMTGQAIERFTPAAPAVLSDQEIRSLEFQSRAIVALDPRIKGDKEKGLALAITLWNYGVPVTPVNAKKLHLIGDDIFESAQFLLGLLTMHGYDAWVVEDTEERAVVRGQRPGSSRVHEVVYDVARAARSHALDEWVERKYRNDGDRFDRTEKFVVTVDGRPVGGPIPDWARKAIDLGRVRRNEYWFSYRPDALLNRALRRLAKRMGADALLGVGGPADDTPARIPARDDDIVEVEEAEEQPVPASRPEEEPDPAAVHRNECGRIASAMGRIPDGLWRQQWAKAWREAGLPGSAHELAPEQLEPARQLIRQYIALAVLAEAGISSTADRHAFVHAATNGETESTKGLSAEQFDAVYRAAREAASLRDQLAEDQRLEAEAMRTPDQEPDYGPGEEPF